MKSIISILVLLVAFSFNANAQSLDQKANAAYDKDNFREALNLYEQAEKAEGSSSALYFNIGNTYYRLGNMGKAILYYERALLLDPNNEDARTNLDFVNDKVQLKIDRGGSFFSDFIDSVVSGYSSDTWGYVAIACFLLMIGAILLYIFVDIVILRKIGFFGGGILLVVTILANVCAFYMKAKVEKRNYAIVTVPSVTLSTSPRQPKDKSEEAFLLNEGTKVEILDSVTNKLTGNVEKWLDVRADDQHRAWVNAKNIEKI